MATYREDMRRAWERINSFPTQRLETPFGTIEYADRGEGVPLLLSHGVLGCHVDTDHGWWADLAGPGLPGDRTVTLRLLRLNDAEDATPADQAEAYAMLLDHLGVDRAVVIAFSAGSGSVLEFARRHPERVIGLIPACCRLGGGITTPQAFRAALPSRLQLRPALLDLQEGHAGRVLADDGEARGMGPCHGNRRRWPTFSSPSNPGATVPSSTGSSRTSPRTGSPSRR